MDRVYRFQAFHEALGEADFVVLCLPLTEITRHCIADGEPFFEQRFGDGDKPLPRFRGPMNANEAMEFIVDTLAISDAGEIRTSALRPAEFGAHAGFRFDLGYRDASGLEGRGLALGAVIDGRLYLVLYLAAAEHYFAAYGGPVERMIDSLETP